jgi:hypothetical protein
VRILVSSCFRELVLKVRWSSCLVYWFRFEGRGQLCLQASLLLVQSYREGLWDDWNVQCSRTQARVRPSCGISADDQIDNSDNCADYCGNTQMLGNSSCADASCHSGDLVLIASVSSA